MQLDTGNNSDSHDELLDEFDATLMILGRLMTQHHHEPCDTSKVHGPRLLVLRVLAEIGSSKTGDIAAVLGIKPPATTSLIDSLERDGLVERTNDPQDRRVTIVQMTPAGEVALREGEQTRREHMKRYMSVLSDDDIRSLIRIQRTLISSIIDND